MSQRSVISIGNFDGVHLAHQAILGRARQAAQAHDARVVAITFDPHPARTLRPGAEPPRLTSIDERVRRLKAAGADEVVVLEPTPAVLSQSATQFIEGLIERYRPAAFVEGADFRFGKGRGGDMALLREWGERAGFDVLVQPAVEVELGNGLGVPVSSSLARWLVGRGRVLDAGRCLGQWFELAGTVTTGEQQGRTLGVPTANLDPAAFAEYIIPADGVYAGTVRLASGAEHAAALSVGVKPALGRFPLAIEAHLLDFAGDLYGQTITVRFARWLRDQYPFPTLDSLVDQLKRDIARTRQEYDLGLFAPPGTPPPARRAG